MSYRIAAYQVFPRVPQHCWARAQLSTHLMMSVYSRSFPLLSFHLRYITEASTLAGENVLGSFRSEITLRRMVLAINEHEQVRAEAGQQLPVPQRRQQPQCHSAAASRGSGGEPGAGRQRGCISAKLSRSGGRQQCTGCQAHTHSHASSSSSSAKHTVRVPFNNLRGSAAGFGSGTQSPSPCFPTPALRRAPCPQLAPRTALTARSGSGSTAQTAAPRSAGRPPAGGGWRCRHRRSESTSETGSLGAAAPSTLQKQLGPLFQYCLLFALA